MRGGRTFRTWLTSRSLTTAGVGYGAAMTPATTNVYYCHRAQKRAFGAVPYRKQEHLQAPSEHLQAPSEHHGPTNDVFSDIAFVFDIDGVLYKGQEAIPGAREMLHKIRQQGMRYVFLTNGGGVAEDAKVASLAKRLSIENPDEVLKDRLVLSHTPMRDFYKQIKEHETALITSSHPETARQIAKDYGFKRVITPADILAASPHIYPFAHLRDSLHKESSPLPDGKSACAITDPHSQDIPDEALKIDHIFVWNDPRDWSVDIQIICDLLVSHRGYLGTISELNGDESLTNNGWQMDGQPTLWFSNLDLFWKTEHPVNRFGTGAFREALDGVWRGVMKRHKQGAMGTLRHKSMGKPAYHAYKYVHRRLLSAGGSEGGEKRRLRKVYMIGDNPESDIRGANKFNPGDNSKWESILVRTGVFQPTKSAPEPRYKPTAVVDDVVDAVVWALKKEGADVTREWLLSGS